MRGVFPKVNELQEYHRDIMGCVSDHCNKGIWQQSKSNEVFGFVMHIRVMFTLWSIKCKKHYV